MTPTRPNPTRQAGLDRLHDFIPQMGSAYAHGRNTDQGPDRRQDVSMLSPYLRRRLITETEVVAAARQAHGEAAEKFVQEIAWRTYFKGWLEQHPSAWTAYLAGVKAGENRLATESGLRRVHHDACLGQAGIDGFDDWARELVERNWLHNHARMWFASIWIFTLRLPWEVGAAFFMRHLLDADPASNTLSWRWVAGLHTRGKHYVARADNIARYTAGRFDPRGQLDETPEPLTEAFEPARVPLPKASRLPEGGHALLLHDDDLHPEAAWLRDATEIAAFVTASGASNVTSFAENAMADLEQRLGRPVTRLQPDAVAAWIAGRAKVVTPWAPVGANADILRDTPVLRVRRGWDDAIWPHAYAGYFKVKTNIP